jgi:hypothetical protein
VCSGLALGGRRGCGDVQGVGGRSKPLRGDQTPPPITEVEILHTDYLLKNTVLQDAKI